MPDPIKALANLDALVSKIQLSREGHIQVSKDVECIRVALTTESAEG